MDRYTQQLHGPPYNNPTESPACVLEQLKQVRMYVHTYYVHTYIHVK